MLERSKGRGSRYRKKIDPISILISYEGVEDEHQYFVELKNRIPRRFENNIRIIPVKKSDHTRSAPTQVLSDLESYIERNNISLNNKRSSNVFKAFLVIDKDHYFTGKHQSNTSEVIRKCKQKNIRIACSTPSFDIWLILHFQDLSLINNDIKLKMLENKSGKNKLSFCKKYLNSIDKSGGYNYKVAIENASKIREVENSVGDIPPNCLFSQVFYIFEELRTAGMEMETW